jgi:hypothetical protein
MEGLSIPFGMLKEPPEYPWPIRGYCTGGYRNGLKRMQGDSDEGDRIVGYPTAEMAICLLD